MKIVKCANCKKKITWEQEVENRTWGNAKGETFCSAKCMEEKK